MKSTKRSLLNLFFGLATLSATLFGANPLGEFDMKCQDVPVYRINGRDYIVRRPVVTKDTCREGTKAVWVGKPFPLIVDMAAESFYCDPTTGLLRIPKALNNLEDFDFTSGVFKCLRDEDPNAPSRPEWDDGASEEEKAATRDRQREMARMRDRRAVPAAVPPPTFPTMPRY